jgi:branched-chain amino acid transport system permease protein
LIGGLVAVSIALQGMIQTFAVRDILAGIVSMGQSLLLLAYFGAAYMALRRAAPSDRQLALAIGALSGLLSGVLLDVLIWIGGLIDLGSVFINATPQLYSLLTFDQSMAVGSLIQPLLAVAAGLVASLIYLLPPVAARPVSAGLSTIIIMGFLQDWILRTVGNTPASVRAILSFLSRILYSRTGMSIIGAVILFVLVAGVNYLSARRRKRAEPVRTVTPARQRAYRAAWISLIILALLLLPILLGIENSEILDNVGMYLLMGLGLNIVVGFAGLLDLGYVAFFAIGAYAVGVLTSPELGRAAIMNNWWPALPFGLVAAVLAGVILGVPVLKMRGDYLAIVTLGFGEIIRIVAGSDMLKPYLGGAQGTRTIARPDIGPIQFGLHEVYLPLLGKIRLQFQQEFFYLFLIACVLAIFIATRLKASRLGRAWMAVREDEDVAQAMGINLVATKLLAFAMGAFFGGLSGAIYASKLGSIFPHSFNFLISINVLAVIIIGGMGSIPGVIVGALALVALPELTREFAEFRYLLYGAGLVLMMLTRPEGLWPEARRRLELHEEAALAESKPTAAQAEG